MSTFHAFRPEPSAETSRLLHPATQSTPPGPVPGPEVLAEIAAGLARTVPVVADLVPDRRVLLATPAYEAIVESIGPGVCQVIDVPPGLPVSLAVVSGEVLVWTNPDGSAILQPGAVCSADGGERIELADIGDEPAVIVLVAALDQTRPDEAATLARCWSPMP